MNSTRQTIKRMTAVILAFILTAGLLSSAAAAKVLYMPDVTPEMSKASYWSDKMAEPDQVLAGLDGIFAINKAIADGEGTNVIDIASWSKDTFDGAARSEKLLNAAISDAQYFFNGGAVYSPDMTSAEEAYKTWEEAYEGFYKAMIDNVVDPEAAAEMPVQYAICTKRCCVLCFPSDKPTGSIIT